MVATIGGTYGEMPKATQAGYIFKGWYTKAEGSSKVTAASTVTAAKARTLYAHWKAGSTTAAITGFSMSSRASSRRARPATVECTLRGESVSGAVCKILWTPSLDGEWTVLKRWTAVADGETAVTVEVPSNAATGFFRLVESAD